MSCKAAAGLSRLGLQAGQTVAVLLPNCPQAIITYYAALHLGAVVAMINPLAAPREILDQMQRTGAKIAVVLDHLAPKMEQIRPELKLRHLLVVSLSDFLPVPWNWLYTFKSRWDKQQIGPRRDLRQKNFSSLLAEKIAAAPPLAARSQDVATLQYTGGTTGPSQGCHFDPPQSGEQCPANQCLAAPLPPRRRTAFVRPAFISRFRYDRRYELALKSGRHYYSFAQI